jgi:hypothetical protein
MSQQPITIDDIYALFRTSAQEFDRRIAEQERLAAIAYLTHQTLDRLLQISAAVGSPLVAPSHQKF